MTFATPQDWDNIATGVGYVAMNAARVEKSTAMLCWQLLDSSYGRLAATGLPWGQLHQMCIALLDERRRRAGDEPPEYLGSIREVLQAAKDLMEQRNRVMHSYWLADQDEDYTLPIAHLERRLRDTVVERWDRPRLDRLATELRYCAAAVMVATVPIIGERNGDPDESDEPPS